MDKRRINYISTVASRFIIAFAIFAVISLVSNKLAYYTGERMTADVDEDVIRILHLVCAILSYHSFILVFTVNHSAARERYFDSDKSKIRYFTESGEVRISLIVGALCFWLIPDAFGVKSLCGLFNISRVLGSSILAAVFIAVHLLTWLETLINWKKTEEKLRKEKSKRKDIWILIKGTVSASLAYTILSYIVPVMFPTFRTLPSVVYIVVVAILPTVICFILFFKFFDYIRALFIRRKFVSRLKKAAKKNGYELSKIRHPYASVFADTDEYSFIVKAHGKTYTCKLIAGVSYGDPMYLEENGKGRIIRSLTVRFRSSMAGPFSRGGLIWHKLPDDIAQYHTEFNYGFEGEGTKVIIVSPTPHTIYCSGHGNHKIVDVNDKIFGYTLMTGSAFINALERDAVK